LKGQNHQLQTVLGMVALATALWFVTFYLKWGIFWFKIAVSASVLAAISLRAAPEGRLALRFDGKSLLIGIVSAFVLYAIFWMGKIFSTALFPLAQQQIGAIYGKRGGTPLWLIALLLFFVTGPCEEIFWRGYMQRQLVKRFGALRGWALATAIYAGVHVWSFNFMLIGAAAVAGAFWGALYWRLRRLEPVIVSHAVWSTFIFAVLPVP
jgi:membrane protease YdiL (CAAX protease family)